jgi:DNA-binding SARP family transcriptional activator
VASVSPAQDSRLPIGIAFGTGVLAGGAAASLARLRHRQRQTRRRGRRIPVPASAPVAVAEQRLNVAAAQESMTALRGVLSHLAAALVATPQQMPEIAALLVQPDLLEILLASPAAEPPPAPFTVAGGRQGKAWQLWLDDEPPDPADGAGDLVPGLLTIGASGGGYLLADLEHLQVTTVDGPASMTAAVLRSAAAELATGQLAGWYDLILVGFPELAALGGRGSCCESLDAGLDLLTAKAVALRRRLGESPAADVRHHRLVDPDDEDWALTLLVSSVPPTSGQLALLSDLAADPGGIAALVPGGAEPSSGHRLPATISLSAGPVGSDFIVARLWPLQLEARPQSLGDADYEALTSLFVTAAEAHDLSPSDPPYDGWLWPPDLAAGGGPDGRDLDGGDLDGGDLDGGDLDGGDLDGRDLAGDDPGASAAARADSAGEYSDDDGSGGGFADDGSGAGDGSRADDGSDADYAVDDGPAVLDGWPGEDEWAAEPVLAGDTWAAPNWAGEPGWAPDPGWAADPAVLTAVTGRNGAESGDADPEVAAGRGGDGGLRLADTERGDAVTGPEAAEGWAEVGGLQTADGDDAGGLGAGPGLDDAGGVGGAAGLDDAGGLGAGPSLDDAGGLGAAAGLDESGGLDAAASWSDVGDAGAEAGWPGGDDPQEGTGWAQDPAVTGLPGAPAAWLSEPPADPPGQDGRPASDPAGEARPDAPAAPGSASPGDSAAAAVAAAAAAAAIAAAAAPAAVSPVPAGPVPAAPAAPAVEESLRIGVLGTFTINGQPGALLPAQSQLVLALALNGTSGLSNQQLCYLLGADPDRPKPSDSLRQLIVRTRRQLGRAPDRREWIEHLGGGQYALHPLARFDWHEFDALATEGMRSRDAHRLRRALGLIRGRPFTGCYYWWLDLALTETVRAQIVDAADVLAALELAGRDPAAAARAARIGLAGDAGAEQLWRALMRAEHAAGNLSGVREAWSRCLDAISEIAPDGEPHPGTAAVYRELLGDAPAHPAWAGGGRPG